MGIRLAQLCKEGGGHLSREDLTHYQVIERASRLRPATGVRSCTPTHPLRPAARSSATRWRRSRAEAATPDLIALALAETQRARASLLDDSDQVSRGTTHISVVDEDGNVAAMTLSNGEGSGCLIPGTGIMTNNMLGEEDINPAGIDNWQPDRRLGSMMAPTLVLGEGYQVALGSGGSNRIRSAIVQVLVAPAAPWPVDRPTAINRPAPARGTGAAVSGARAWTPAAFSETCPACRAGNPAVAGAKPVLRRRAPGQPLRRWPPGRGGRSPPRRCWPHHRWLELIPSGLPVVIDRLNANHPPWSYSRPFR